MKNIIAKIPQNGVKQWTTRKAVNWEWEVASGVRVLPYFKMFKDMKEETHPKFPGSVWSGISLQGEGRVSKTYKSHVMETGFDLVKVESQMLQ